MAAESVQMPFLVAESRRRRYRQLRKPHGSAAAAASPLAKKPTHYICKHRRPAIDTVRREKAVCGVRLLLAVEAELFWPFKAQKGCRRIALQTAAFLATP